MRRFAPWALLLAGAVMPLVLSDYSDQSAGALSGHGSWRWALR
jgi:hypothetical protein